jgi:hypothetical protein
MIADQTGAVAMIHLDETAADPLRAETLGRRMGQTRHVSPLRRHAAEHGLRDAWDLLTLAVQRGCRHCAGVAPARGVTDPGERVLANEELAVLLLAGENRFEPFLIRAAAELLRVVPMDVRRLAWLARRERVTRVLAYIACAGAQHDPEGGAFWRELVAALGPVAPVAPGVLPHWSRFVALRGVARGGRALGNRWIGAAS